jgi:hypothetical protein
MLHFRPHLSILLPLLLLGCTPGHENDPPPDRADTPAVSGEYVPVSELQDGMVPPAVAGDPGWEYFHAVSADLNGDGRLERAVLISNVEVHDRRPVWEDGHHWQLYLETAEGERTHLYARFLPHGRASAWLVQPAEEGETPRILLLEQTPHRVAAYEIEYLAPDEALARPRFEYALDPRSGFSQMPEE